MPFSLLHGQVDVVVIRFVAVREAHVS
jgi:hypothetical protein